MTSNVESPGGRDGERSVFERLRREARQATDGGRLEAALALYDQSLLLARRIGDADLVDLAFCNRCALLISLERADGLLRDLREILSRSANRANRLLAAYNLARIYEHRRDPRKGLLYTRIVLDESQRAPDPYWLAASHNQMANFLVLESRFEEAAEQYGRALAADPQASEQRRATVWRNLGYCHLILGEHGEGFTLIHRALRELRRGELYKERMGGHLDLCYGHLEVGRYGHARRHGLRALDLAERCGDANGLKNALYLLGEAENLRGDEEAARRCFDRLQRLFPDTPFLTDFLLAIDIRQMINLRA